MDANRLKTCNCCGSKLNLSLLEKNKYVKCEYCDAYNDINIHDEKFERLIDEVKIELRNGNFDKADEKVEELLSTYKDEPLVYFYKVLVDCKIVYVKEDPDDEESKGIPTYTSIKFNSPAVTKYGKKCLEKEKDSKIAASYEKVFNTIERDREAIKKLLTDKDPRHDYDVFICFKKSDIEDPSKDTPEAKEAHRLYTYLCKTYGDKLKVFYAPESLDGSAPWEQLIFNALARAKLLIVIGYSSDTLNATWVKNEWNRFIDMMEDGNFGDKEIFVAGASDGNVSYIPKKLKKYQAKPADTSLHAEIKKTIDDVIFYSQNNDKEENTPKEVAPIKKTVKYEILQDVGKIEQAKVRTFEHNDRADVEIDLVLAKTDPELAIKHLNDESRYPNQDDPDVKKAKFVIKHGDINDIGNELIKNKFDFDSLRDELEDIVDTESFNDIFVSLVLVAGGKIAPLKCKMALLKYLFEHYGYIENIEHYAKELVTCSYKLFTERKTLKDNDWKEVIEYFDDLYKITYSKCEQFGLDKANLTYFVCLRAMRIFNKQKFDEYFKGLPQGYFVSWKDIFNLSKVFVKDNRWAYQVGNKVVGRTVVYASYIEYLYETAPGPADVYEDVDTVLIDCIKETDSNSGLAVLHYLQMVNEFLYMIDVKKSDTQLLDEYYDLTLEYVIRNNKEDEYNAKFVTEQHKLFVDAINLIFSKKSKDDFNKAVNELSAKFADSYVKNTFIRLANSHAKKTERIERIIDANHHADELINKKIYELNSKGKEVPKKIQKEIDDLKNEKNINEYNKKANRILDVVDNQIANNKMKREQRKVFAAQIMYTIICITFAFLLGYFGFFDHNDIKAHNEETGIIIAYAWLVVASGFLFTYLWSCKKRENNLTKFMHCALGGITVFLSYLFFASFGYLIYTDVGHALVTDTFYVVRMTSTPVIGVLLFIASIVCFGDIRETDYLHLVGTSVFIAVNIFAGKSTSSISLLYLVNLLFATIGFVNYFRIILYHEKTKTSMRICTLISFAIAIAAFSVCIPTFQSLGNSVYLAASNIKWLEVIYLVLTVLISGAPIIGLTWYNIYLMVSGDF